MMDNSCQIIKDKLTSLGENEMQMFRFLLGKPSGVILTVETDKILASLLAQEGLVDLTNDMVIIPDSIRTAYLSLWSEETELMWQKQNWMCKCIEAGRYLYGVMTWDVLGQLFRLGYPDADEAEIRGSFKAVPANSQWFTERGGKLVLNGFEKDDYYKYLEQQIQRDIPFYIPKKHEVEELYEQGSLVSREDHTKLRDFISDTFGCDKDTAAMKVHELYEAVNNHVRVNDAAEAFASDDSHAFSFPSDEIQVRFIELFMEMSRECRIRDNRGHDYYEMVSLMAGKNLQASAEKDHSKTLVKRVKIGRNEPCPCGSGKKYKNCCGKN